MRDDEAVLEFVPDAREILENIESQAISLEDNFTNTKFVTEAINHLFRGFHTLKGSSGFYNLPNVVSVSHEMESILNLVREDLTKLDISLIQLIIELKDLLVQMFEKVEIVYNDHDFKKKASSFSKKLIQKKNTLARTEDKSEKNKTNAAFGLFEEDEPKATKPAFGLFDEEEPKSNKPAFEIFDEEIPKIKKPAFGLFDDEENASLPPATIIKDSGEIAKEVKPSDEDTKSTESIKKTIRIDTEKLDVLLDSVGELVIAESLVTQHGQFDKQGLEIFQQYTLHLHKIVRNLQDITLRLRMVPISNLIQKMQRLVRDVSAKLNKKVEFKVIGGDTDVDKSILENILDPLVHILRNAIDHGLEASEQRLKIGKREVGTITMEARHVGNEVWVIISDDGKGMDRKKILEKVRQNNLIEGDGSNLTDQEVWDFIFLPGFTTASNLSDLSGRGVGMDVVKKNISKLNGSIEIHSRAGQGSSFVLRVPLTLAIIDGMVVMYKGKHYIIPTLDVSQTLNLIETKLYPVNETQFVVKYQEKMIPIITLHNLLGADDTNFGLTNKESKYIIIVESESHSVGILFDEILGNQSIVIKSLSELLIETNMRGFSGCTILGNGKIGFILDIKSLIEQYYSFGKKNVANSLK